MTHRARNYPSYAMTSSSKSKSHCHYRSLSLPCRLHPSTLKFEEGLKKIKAWEASPTPNGERICYALSGLEELYMCIDELLKLNLTQQAISHQRREEWIDGVLDGSLRLIDGCGIIIKVMSQIREHVRDLQSALWRIKGDSSAGSSIAGYTCFRNKVKKDAKKLMEEVKQIDKRIEESSLFGLDHQVSSVTSVLREVIVTSSSIFHSILLFLSISTLKPKATRWSLVSRLKGTVVGVDQHIKVTELENVDFALHTMWKCSCEGDGKQIAQNRLGSLEMSIEAIENCLECLFRTVIRARASILNVVSL